MRGRRHSRRALRGAALLLAMVIVVLVSATVSGMVWQQSRAVQVEGAERARAQAAWILAGALDWARLILREDQRRGAAYDALDEPWATPLAEARLSSFLAADRNNNADGGPEAFISGQIADAQSRLNLRGLIGPDGKPLAPRLEGFKRLCALAGVGEDAAVRITAALAATAVVTVPGPGSPVPSADGPLRPQRLHDLAWAGIDRAVLDRLSTWVDLLPTRTPVNVNTAAREALVAAVDGLDVGGAERLVQARQRTPLRSTDEIARLLPGLTVDGERLNVASSYFIVTGRLRLEDRVLEERSLLFRQQNQVDVVQRERRSYGTALP